MKKKGRGEDREDASPTEAFGDEGTVRYSPEQAALVGRERDQVRQPRLTWREDGTVVVGALWLIYVSVGATAGVVAFVLVVLWLFLG
jgi:hypothetical protein